MKPTRFFLLSLFALGAFALLLALDRGLDIGLPIVIQEAFWVFLTVFILIGVLDAYLSRNLPVARIRRILPDRFFVGRAHKIKLEVHHQRSRAWLITLYDYYPDTWQAKDIPCTFKLLPEKVATIEYELTPLTRGDASFTQVEQVYYSRMGLWQFSKKLPVPSEAKVMPDFAQVFGADITGLERWMNLLGAKRTPRRGFGMDFHQLREYRDGDTIKQIDWKATARKHALVSREYQDERDQQIIFLLDCSRNMRSVDGALSHFDHALNAMLLLTYTALRHDDAVGVLTYSHPTPRFIAPAKGVAQRVRNITGLETDGGTLFQTAFSKKDPYLYFNLLKTESEISEFTGLKELLESIFHLVRNPQAHTPKINWIINEEKALDVLTLISLAHKYLDECKPVPYKVAK